MRRWQVRFFVILGVMLTIVTSSHLYFIRRLVIETQLPEPFAAIAKSVILTAGALLFVHPISERTLRLPPRKAAWLGWPAYVWLGSSFYLLVTLSASDLALLALRLGGVDEDLARPRALAVIGIASAIALYGIWTALGRGPQVKRVEVQPAGWPLGLDGYRVVQISDVHIGTLLGERFAARIARACNALSPDLIAITGDLVDGSVTHLEDRVRPLTSLRASDGVYFVTGNHDTYSGAASWCAKLREFGFEVLRNRRVRVARGQAAFELAGVDDYSTSRWANVGLDCVATALSNREPSTPIVLLAHDPRTFAEARTQGIALQLSGHTHAGQMWPFAAFVRLQTPHVAGLYRSGDAQLYVNRGTGFWGPPLRVFAPSEITEVVLRAAR